jgi:hypothetical protein
VGAELNSGGGETSRPLEGRVAPRGTSRPLGGRDAPRRNVPRAQRAGGPLGRHPARWNGGMLRNFREEAPAKKFSSPSRPPARWMGGMRHPALSLGGRHPFFEIFQAGTPFSNFNFSLTLFQKKLVHYIITGPSGSRWSQLAISGWPITIDPLLSRGATTLVLFSLTTPSAGMCCSIMCGWYCNAGVVSKVHLNRLKRYRGYSNFKLEDILTQALYCSIMCGTNGWARRLCTSPFFFLRERSYSYPPAPKFKVQVVPHIQSLTLLKKSKICLTLLMKADAKVSDIVHKC